MRQIRRHTNLKSLYTLLFFLLSSCLSLEILKCVCLPSFSASLLKGLRHANIVTLHDIIHTKETLTFVFEYVVSLSKIFQWHYYSSVDTFSQKAQLYSTDVLNIAKSCKTSSWKRSIFSIGVTYIITSQSWKRLLTESGTSGYGIRCEHSISKVHSSHRTHVQQFNKCSPAPSHFHFHQWKFDLQPVLCR